MAKKQKDLLHPTDAQLRQELLEVNNQLKGAYERFNCVCEPELIDSCIYEISSLKAKYDYLLRCIKERSGQTLRPAEALYYEPAIAASQTKGGPTCLS